jgi:hypothetical protein
MTSPTPHDHVHEFTGIILTTAIRIGPDGDLTLTEGEPQVVTLRVTGDLDTLGDVLHAIYLEREAENQLSPDDVTADGLTIDGLTVI